jgi:diguanylate cyclase (GGDEF)-like protein
MNTSSGAGFWSRRWSVRLYVLFNAAFIAWLLIKPGSHDVFVAVDNVAAFLGILLPLPFCWSAIRQSGSSGTADTPSRRRYSWTPLLLCLGIFSYAIGQIIYTVYEQILHYFAPFPSWADAAFLIVYPFFLLGILLLPTRPIPLTSRTRVVIDGLMIMTALVTFSWFFVLGPTMTEGADSLFAQIVGDAYPFCDLLLIVCLLVLTSRMGGGGRSWLYMLQGALSIIVLSDTVFDYQTLHNAYHTGSLLDDGWPLGFMLVGLAVQRLGADMGSSTWMEETSPARVPLWRALLPYAFVPAVGALLLYTWNGQADHSLQVGVTIGGAGLIGLVLARQVLALVENNRLYRALATEHSALAAANAQLEALATTDPLTGLANHRAMVGALEHEVERSRRYDRGYAALFLDIDHFKALNDSYGHGAGDAALREFAEVVRAASRNVDILGRWGGEEFLVLVPEADRETALSAAERIRAAVAAHSFAVGGGCHLTCSVGFAIYPDDADDRDTLVARADQAMYAAKRLGRNQVRWANDEAVDALLGEMGGEGSREEAALMGTVEALATLVGARDQYAGKHLHEVTDLSLRLALSLGLNTSEARMVGLAGRLYDVGKVAVPDTVLLKPGRLTEDEWRKIQTHPVVGADVIGRVPALRALQPAIRAHHERWDGTGYPDGLAGEAIPLTARILAVADAYRAITSDRPYAEAHSPEWALAELRRCAGSQFDPTVVAILEGTLEAEQHTKLAS